MTNDTIKNLIFVDCEAKGKSPSTGKLTEFGAVAYPSKASFHGILEDKEPVEEKEVFEKFDVWLTEITNGEKPIFVSDNPAFDWQWINDGFLRTIGKHELDETEAKVVKMIYDWYTEDKLNIRQIQAKLFELKIPTKYDALKNTEKNRKMKGLKKYPMGWWSEVTIRNVLPNEAYTGRWYCGKNQTIKLDVANLRTGKPKVRQIKRAIV